MLISSVARLHCLTRTVRFLYPPCTSRPFVLNNMRESAWRFHVVLTVAQAGFAGYEFFVGRTLVEGTSILVLSLYRYCGGFLVLRLLSNAVDKDNKPVLDFSALLATLLLGSLGVAISELCYLQGLKHTSPVFASSMRNMIPVFTLILALVFRMERIELGRGHGKAKLAGSLLIFCGCILLLLFKGREIVRSHISAFSPRILKEVHHSVHIGSIHIQLNNEQYGIIFLLFSCISFSIFLILQGFIMEKYAAPVSFASFATFFALIEVGIVAGLRIRNKSAWLSFNFAEAIGLAYAALIGTGLVLSIQSWGVQQGGPVLVAAYQPLETVVTVILAFLLSKESLRLGSILLLGSYLIVWGKEREQKILAVSVVRDFHGITIHSNFENDYVREMDRFGTDHNYRMDHVHPEPVLDSPVSAEHDFPRSSSLKPRSLSGEQDLPLLLSRHVSLDYELDMMLKAVAEGGDISGEISILSRMNSGSSMPFSRANSVRSTRQNGAGPSRVNSVRAGLLSRANSTALSRASSYSFRSLSSRVNSTSLKNSDEHSNDSHHINVSPRTSTSSVRVNSVRAGSFSRANSAALSRASSSSIRSLSNNEVLSNDSHHINVSPRTSTSSGDEEAYAKVGSKV